MIKYRKNKEWGTHSLSVNKTKNIDSKIKEQSLWIQGKYPDKIIDIIDISIRSTFTPEIMTDYSTEIHYITICYAIITENKNVI